MKLVITSPRGYRRVWQLTEGHALKIRLASSGIDEIVAGDPEATFSLTPSHGKWIFELLDRTAHAKISGMDINLILLPEGTALQLDDFTIALEAETAELTEQLSTTLAHEPGSQIWSAKLPDHPPFLFVWVGPSLTVGRGSNFHCDQQFLTIPDEGVSQQHCRIQRSGEELLVNDLGSRNGTRLAGRRIKKPTVFKPHHQIQIGRAVLRLHGAARPRSKMPHPLNILNGVLLILVSILIGGWLCRLFW